MPTKDPEKLRGQRQRWYAKHGAANRAKHKERRAPAKARYSREYGQRLRHAAIAYLGDSCKHCGFADTRALQIDHVNGGGHIERETVGAYNIWRRVVSGQYDGRYQLLCANCNWIKRAENGETGNRKYVDAR